MKQFFYSGLHLEPAIPEVENLPLAGETLNE